MSNKYDVIFFYSGIPLPAMLEVVDHASKIGKKCLLIIINRGSKDLLIDSALVNYDVRTINVTFGSFGQRVISTLNLLPKCLAIIFNNLQRSGIVMSSNFDTLLLAWIARFFKKFELRHQIRDLHQLQLSGGALAKLIQSIEKLIIKRVSILIVSSFGFVTAYYSKIYNGQIVVVENIPRKSVWNNFSKKQFGVQPFVIGFIGVLRYKKSLFRLIRAVEKLSDDGFQVRVKFAGGAMGDEAIELKSYINNLDIFDFSGPYAYSRDIKNLYSDVDLIFAVYDEYDLNCRVALPNKIYESMITKIPVLVAQNTYVAQRVDELKIGVAVAIDEPEDLYKKLLAIFEKGPNWYATSTDALQNDLTSELYNEYDRAIARSVES
jgi:succinoglycan biosynthesis protein ExoL|tara:strand:+ start:366 stop:1499 length:1134 start_codon:yes stop_codon:yes gene_type:complete